LQRQGSVARSGTARTAATISFADYSPLNAYWLQRDAALKAFVVPWLHIAVEDGSFKKIYAAWFG
jgi:hypothetical protein